MCAQPLPLWRVEPRRTGKIANQCKDFHHKLAGSLVARCDLLVVKDLQIANMRRRAKPVPDPGQPRRLPGKWSPGAP
jgi:transposase